MNRKNVSTFLSFAFLIVVICSALLPVLSLQNNVSILSHGTVNYPEPPTTSPEAKIQGTNYAPLSVWHASPKWAPCYWEPTGGHDGKGAWRNEGVDPYETREMNAKKTAVKPGDRIVLQAWMKVAPSDIGTTSELCPQSGARIGFDFYDDDGLMFWDRAAGRSAGLAYNPDGNLPQWPPPTDGVVANFVGWGTTTWTFRKIDCIVPTTIDGKTPKAILPWFAAMTNRIYGDYRRLNEDAPAWLSETELIIIAP